MPHATLRVVMPMATDFFGCMHCERMLGEAGLGEKVHQQQLQDFPEDLRQDGQRMAAWLQGIARRYGPQLIIQVIDPQSPEGFLTSLRFWVRKYPTFILNSRVKVTGWDRAALESALRMHLETSPAA